MDKLDLIMEETIKGYSGRLIVPETLKGKIAVLEGYWNALERKTFSQKGNACYLRSSVENGRKQEVPTEIQQLSV
jgi:hypothetical protein